MKKILSLAVVLLCAICSWAQTSVSTFAELKSAFSTGGNVKLTADILMDDGLRLKGTTQLVLDLNGHTLDRGMTEYTDYEDVFPDFGVVFIVEESSKLTINDSSAGQTGKITGVTAYGVIILGNTATVIFNGGSICNNHCRSAIITTYEGNTATFIMNGGSIKDNIIEAENDKRNSVIWCGENTTVKLYGGEISGNRLHQSVSDYYLPSNIYYLPSCISVNKTEIGGTIVIKDNIVYEGTEESALGISNIDKIKISTTTPLADGAEIHVTGTTGFELTGLTSDNVKYFVSDETGAELYCNENGKLTVHVHSWATTWTQTETHHYHACSATGCGITDYSTAPAGAAYGTHVYGTDITQTVYYTCSTCQYENATRKQEYMDAIDAAAAAAATAKVNAIGTVVYTEECKALIDAAREAIDALTEAQQAYVTLATYTVLTTAEAKYAELEADALAAAAVVEKIEAIGTVEYTDASLALISDARTAYNALTAAQKALITAEQLKVLEDAEARYTKLKTDALAAAAVVEKIEAIGTVEYTPECKAKIDAARAAYDALTEDQKALITAEQLKTLEDAEAEYHVLMLKAMAQPVIDLIDAIAPVDDSYATAKAISDARIAYDNLIAEAKPYVTNYDDLVAAETLYNQMVSFDSYRNSRALLLGARLTQFDNAEVRREVAGAAQKIQALEYVEELTLEENKKRVDEIYNTYLDILRESRYVATVSELMEIAKHNGKASIMLFVAASDSQRAIDAANEGIAKIDALEYDYEADLSANLDDVFDIVIDTKINIVKAWQADFEDLKAEIIDEIRRIIGIGSQAEAKVAGMYYDYSLTREENNAKLNDVMQSLGGTTGINAVSAASAKNGKYVENGKIVIVKNGKAYTAAGQLK